MGACVGWAVASGLLVELHDAVLDRMSESGPKPGLPPDIELPEKAPGAGDPFFPLAGNGGYDVRHYSLDLDYVRGENRLSGQVGIFARATQKRPMQMIARQLRLPQDHRVTAR